MAFLYPWGNTQQLNLDWILQKIKELETGGGASLDEVANALISASYAVQAYDRSDIVFRDGKLYRANQAIPAPGEAWTPAHWNEILLGDTMSNLVQYVAALSNNQILNNSSVSGTHTSDALDNLKGAINDLESVVNNFTVVDSSLTGTLETLCPRAGASALALYRVGSSQVTDLPAADGVDWSSNKMLFVFSFGGSTSNHMYYVVPSATSGVIGRVFAKLTRSGTDSWKELMLGEIGVGQTLVDKDISTGVTGLFASKYGNVVTLYTDANNLVLPEITVNGWITLGTLPESLRPTLSANLSASYIRFFVMTNTTATVVVARLYASSGAFQIYGRPAYSQEPLVVFTTYLT